MKLSHMILGNQILGTWNYKLMWQKFIQSKLCYYQGLHTTNGFGAYWSALHLRFVFSPVKYPNQFICKYKKLCNCCLNLCLYWVLRKWALFIYGMQEYGVPIEPYFVCTQFQNFRWYLQPRLEPTQLQYANGIVWTHDQ